MRARGFTLLELLVALVILTVIAAIVYASLSSVMNSTEDVAVEAAELRLREFLLQSFDTNLQTAYVDAAFQQEVFQFIGEDEEGAHGPADTLRFCSTAPIVGAPAMPGDVKEVRYEVLSEQAEGGELDLGGMSEEGEADDWEQAPEMAAHRTLRAMETPLLGANVQELDNEGANFVPASSYEAPTWSLPVRSMNIRYFDGVDWVDGWNSLDMGRLPWCVEIKVNFARTESQLRAETAAQIDPEEDADMTVIVSIPIAVGTTEETRAMDEMMAQEEYMREQGLHSGSAYFGQGGGLGGVNQGNQRPNQNGGQFGGGGSNQGGRRPGGMGGGGRR